MFETKRIEGRAAKLTITAEGVVRVKIPQKFTAEEEAKVQAFFARIVAAAPKLDKTLRGEKYDGENAKTMMMHTGTSKSSIVKYLVKAE